MCFKTDVAFEVSNSKNRLELKYSVTNMNGVHLPTFMRTLFYFFLLGTFVIAFMYMYVGKTFPNVIQSPLLGDINTRQRQNVQLKSKLWLKEANRQQNNQTIYTEPQSLLDLPKIFNSSNIKYHNYTAKHTILWYNPPEWVERRQRSVFMERCEYNNCVYTKDRLHLNNSSAIVFVPSVDGFPRSPPISPNERNPNQVWVVYSLEPPMNFYIDNYKDPNWTNTINWTMTYRFDSDILAPYGTMKSRKIPLVRDYNKLYQKKTKMIAWIVSHCHAISNRDEYVAELKKAGVEIDIFGKCGKSIYHLNDTQVEDMMTSYKFFLSFENSLCKDYITEKIFQKYELDLILIVRGGADYDKLLPTKTFINTAHFPNISSLAYHIRQLADNKMQYIRFLKRKDKYEVMNEDHFGHPYAMCNLCRKLNDIENNKNTYRKITDFLEDRTCRLAEDIPNLIPNPTTSNIYANRNFMHKTI